jgi:uncharacterized membrane protein (DUF485 family)
MIILNLLLRYYKDMFARIWIFSPSIKLDPQYAPLRKYLDKMADQQRIMAWAALVAPPFIIAFMASEWVTLEKVSALNGLATTYCAAMGTIVVAFMAAQAYVRGKAEG